MSWLFAAESVTKAYGERQVLKVASLWLEKGRISALLGRNGSGKSTLLRIATGQLSADQGAIHFRGVVYERPRLRTLAAQGLFYLPDSGLLSRRLPLEEQLDAVRWRFGNGALDNAISRLHLGNLLGQNADELSGGERRRAELALAWGRQPLCLLADEPLAGIQPGDREIVGEELRQLAAAGCAILVTGHEVREILTITHEVVWMTAGTTHGLGAPDDALRHQQFRREYLGRSLE